MFDLIRTAKILENFLNSSNSLLAPLKPRLKVAGSIVEGSRLGKPDELDMSMTFKELLPTDIEFLDTALALRITGRGKKVMKRWIDSDNCLDMTQFMKSILDTLQDCLRISQSRLPSNITLASSQIEWTPCQSCIDRHKENKENNKVEIATPWSHCGECIPNIALSKSGPCVVLRLLESLVSIDIIPLFASPESDPEKLFKLVVDTLTNEKPPEWRSYHDKFVKKCKILSEELGFLKKISNPQITMKVLNFEPESSNYILRPSQPLDVGKLKNKRRKEIYCMMKALKSHFEADVSSYNLKRVLLLPDHDKLVEDETKDKIEVLLELMKYPMIQEEFQRFIDYDAWKALIVDGKRHRDRRHFFVPAIPEE